MRSSSFFSVEKFDNVFFEINDYEAASLDPQQSLVLECTHMALEDGGFTRTQMAGTSTGVFIGEGLQRDMSLTHFYLFIKCYMSLYILR